MFSCHSCQYHTNVVAEFCEHLQSSHTSDNQKPSNSEDSKTLNNENGASASFETSEIKTEIPDENDDEVQVEVKVKPDLLVNEVSHADVEQERSKRGRPKKSDCINDTVPAKKRLKRARPAYKFPCGQCVKVFQNNCDLQRHVSSIHLKLKPFTCDQCGVSFSRMGNLKKHIDGVHKQIKRIFPRLPCPTCGKSYDAKYLDDHINAVHKGEKPFQCEFCGMEFGLERSCSKHIKEVHMKVKNYECELCGTKFARRQHLEAHLKSHQRGTIPSASKSSMSFSD